MSFGNTVSFDGRLGGRTYDLLLEYVSGGPLFYIIKNYGSFLQELEVQDYTRMILKGLVTVHEKGYVHCDLKPENILVVPLQDGTNYVKIVDFGLAKDPKEEIQYGNSSMFRFCGTPLYMSLESFLFGQIKSGLDIWFLGYVVEEMFTSKHAMQWLGGYRGWNFVLQEPYILENMSFLGKYFLRKCFARNLKDQWMAKMLNHHPYLLPGNEIVVMMSTTTMQVLPEGCYIPPP